MWQATQQILPKTQRFQKVSESTWSQLLTALQVCAEAKDTKFIQKTTWIGTEIYSASEEMNL